MRVFLVGVIIMSLFSVNAWDNGFEAGEEWKKRKNNGE